MGMSVGGGAGRKKAISDINVTRGRSDMVAGGLSGLTNRLY